MAASYQFIIDTGTVVADTSTLLQDVQDEYRAALGQTINVASSTPQGTLIAAEVTARSAVMRNNADLANVINPELSFGVFLDAICAFLGIKRGNNQSTRGNGILMNGTVGTDVNVPINSRVQSAAGDIFVLTSSVVIPGTTGSVRANIAAQASGAIPLAIGDLRIVDGTIGWGAASVDVDTTVIIGSTQLNDPQLKIARNQQLATQGVGSSAAIASEVSGLDNVTSVNVVENNTGAAGEVPADGSGINFQLPNAMWVCVSGTVSDDDIGAALYSAHQGGCPWDYGVGFAGSDPQGVPIQPPLGIPVMDPITNVTYFVKATRPVRFDVYVKITVHQNTSVSSPVPAVQNAILSYANGLEQGEPGLVVGADVSAFEMAGAVARQIPGMYVKNCSVAVVPHGDAAPPDSAYVLEYIIAPYQQGEILSGNINVSVS